MTELDFMIIGAQKSGTTSLWAHLREHPGIWMPASKEVPFFSVDQRYARGVDWLMRNFFADAPADALLGKSSPQYMGGPVGTPPPAIAARIAKNLPLVKLIAILRDPVERLVSQYRHTVRRRQTAQKPFEELVWELLDERALKRARQRKPGVRDYVVRGEYGRVLASYLEHFPRRQLLVVFTAELSRNPFGVVAEAFRFLDVDPEFVPETIGTRFLRGGTSGRVSEEATKSLRSYLDRRVWGADADSAGAAREGFGDWLRDSWDGRATADESAVEELSSHLEELLIDDAGGDRRAARQAFRFWFENDWNVVPDDEPMEISLEIRDALRSHYRPDSERLEGLLGVSAPWLAVWSKTSAERVNAD